MSGETTNTGSDEQDDVRRHDLSASAIKTHNKCPKQYYLKYEAGLPRGDVNQYLVVGSLVHDTLETILNQYVDSGEEFASENRLARKIKREFHRREETDEYETVLVSDRLRSDAIESLDTASTFLVNQNPTIRGVEVRSFFELSEIKASALGYMDVCTDTEIWDWKTGRAPDDNETDEDEIIQGSLYMGAYYHEYGELPESIKFVYIKEKTVRTIDASQDNWERMLQRARMLMNSIRGGHYPARPAESKCYWCSYEQHCSASPVSIQQLQDKIDDGRHDLWNVV
jgi:RecB family exonuclease